MWNKIIVLLSVPALSLVPVPVHAQPAGDLSARGSIKAKQGIGGNDPRKKRVKLVRATAKIIRSASVRFGKSKKKVRTKRRFQVNLMPNGRKLIEFE